MRNYDLHMTNDIVGNNNYQSCNYFTLRPGCTSVLLDISILIQSIINTQFQSVPFLEWLTLDRTIIPSPETLLYSVHLQAYTVDTLTNERLSLAYSVSFDHQFYCTNYRLSSSVKTMLHEYHSKLHPFNYYKVIELTFSPK